MIEIKHLTKRYGDVVALADLTATIQAGESIALWGANGAGKTTALRCLLGVLPFEGRITLQGVDVLRQGKAARAMAGYVPQEAALYDMVTHEALAFYARLKKAPISRVADVLAQVGLEAHAHKTVSALSGGMKRRLALASALLADPPVLLLDEPTANLDAQARHEFLQRIKQLNQAGKTVIFSSHRLEEVTDLAARVLVLEEGRLIIDCPAGALLAKLGLQPMLRVRIANSQFEQAIQLLNAQGFSTTPNGKAILIQVNASGKMRPLRALERAEIHIEDFDVVDTESPIVRKAGA